MCTSTLADPMEGARDACPYGPNLFNFMQFQVGTPPLRWAPTSGKLSWILHC